MILTIKRFMVSSIYGIIKKKIYDFVCKMRVQGKDGPYP